MTRWYILRSWLSLRGHLTINMTFTLHNITTWHYYDKLIRILACIYFFVSHGLIFLCPTLFERLKLLTCTCKVFLSYIIRCIVLTTASLIMHNVLYCHKQKDQKDKKCAGEILCIYHYRQNLFEHFNIQRVLTCLWVVKKRYTFQIMLKIML